MKQVKVICNYITIGKNKKGVLKLDTLKLLLTVLLMDLRVTCWNKKPEEADQTWSPQASGIAIKDNYVPDLEVKWSDLTKTSTTS